MKLIYTIAVSFIIIISSILVNLNIDEINALVHLEKPEIIYENEIPQINETEITYLIHALGGDNLHKPPFTDNYPQIEVSTSQKLFTSYIVDGEIQTYLGKSPDPDLQIRLNRDTLINIINSNDAKAATKDAISQQLVGVTIISDKTELFLKGYLELYDTLK